MTSNRPANSNRNSHAPTDAIALLESDHEAVKQLFADYGSAGSVGDRKALVARICTALSVHIQIEEEIFYPAVKAALKDTLLVPEATVEHAGVKDLIAQLEGAEPDGEMYNARVKVLSEYVKHHVMEEHKEMFPQARATTLDMAELGARMRARRDALLAEAA
jgi:hemerythrin-like domain-containing protein